jgi:hypothetical protein
VGTGKRQAKTYSLLIVVKGEDKYLIKYDPEGKSELFDLLLEYGMDDRYNLTSFDALTLIEKIKDSKMGASIIAIDEDEPSIRGNLAFGSPPAEMDGFDTNLDF